MAHFFTPECALINDRKGRIKTFMGSGVKSDVIKH